MKKYIVMEIHEGYAILMDDESVFVHAADLHYEVGQTVTDPVLMNINSGSAVRSGFIITRIAAAAACLAVIAGTGYGYYAKNLKTYSTVQISSEADIKMGLNKKGEVLYLRSDNECGEEILKDYDGKGKDKLTVANELLEIEISKGIITSGDTVDVVISTDSSDDYVSYKDEFENSISGLKLKPVVHDTVAPPKKPKDPVAAPEGEKPVPPQPVEDKNAPAAPPAPVDEAVKPPQPDEKIAEHDAPAPPDIANGQTPAPEIGDKPDAKPEHDIKDKENQPLPIAPENGVPAPEPPAADDKDKPDIGVHHDREAGLPELELKSPKLSCPRPPVHTEENETAENEPPKPVLTEKNNEIEDILPPVETEQALD